MLRTQARCFISCASLAYRSRTQASTHACSAVRIQHRIPKIWCLKDTPSGQKAKQLGHLQQWRKRIVCATSAIPSISLQKVASLWFSGRGLVVSCSWWCSWSLHCITLAGYPRSATITSLKERGSWAETRQDDVSSSSRSMSQHIAPLWQTFCPVNESVQRKHSFLKSFFSFFFSDAFSSCLNRRLFYEGHGSVSLHVVM